MWSMVMWVRLLHYDVVQERNGNAVNLLIFFELVLFFRRELNFSFRLTRNYNLYSANHLFFTYGGCCIVAD